LTLTLTLLQTDYSKWERISSEIDAEEEAEKQARRERNRQQV